MEGGGMQKSGGREGVVREGGVRKVEGGWWEKGEGWR
jgi:hypothetical protein